MTSPSPSSQTLSVDSITDFSDAGLASPFSTYENQAVIVPTLARALESLDGDHGSVAGPASALVASSPHAAPDEEESLDDLGVKSEHFFFAPNMLTFVVRVRAL